MAAADAKKLCELTKDLQGFETMLCRAKNKIRSRREDDLVGDMLKRWIRAGGGMWLTTAQFDKIKEIGER